MSIESAFLSLQGHHRTLSLQTMVCEDEWVCKKTPHRPSIQAAQNSFLKPGISTYFHWIDNLTRLVHLPPALVGTPHSDLVPTKPTQVNASATTEKALPPEVPKAPDDSSKTRCIRHLVLLRSMAIEHAWDGRIKPRILKNSIQTALVTGHDILFFWVARMLLMGEYAPGKLPFPEVFLHGLIYGKSYWRDHKDGRFAYVDSQERLEYDLGKPSLQMSMSKWEKMSKSKGNVLDPIEIIEQYGTDAMRMALCASATQARQIDLDRRRFEEFKNFANKIWNGARFVLMNLEGLTTEKFTKGLHR